MRGASWNLDALDSRYASSHDVTKRVSALLPWVCAEVYLSCPTYYLAFLRTLTSFSILT